MENLLKANGIKIWFEEFGETSNETILLIMGANANCKQWPQEFIDELIKKNFRVIRFDNRDVGKSSWFGKEPTYNKFLKILPAFFLKIIVNRIFGLVVDKKGKFKFSKSAVVQYDLSDMAKDAVSLMDALNIEKAHIVELLWAV